MHTNPAVNQVRKQCWEGLKPARSDHSCLVRFAEDGFSACRYKPNVWGAMMNDLRRDFLTVAEFASANGITTTPPTVWDDVIALVNDATNGGLDMTLDQAKVAAQALKDAT